MQYKLQQGQFNSNSTAIATPLVTNNMITQFGDNSPMSRPLIQGEFTNLLFQAYHEVTASRRLDFDK